MNPQWVVETAITKALLDEGNIIHITYKQDQEETLEEAKHVLAEMKKNVSGKRFPALIDLSTVKVVSGEVRAFHAGKETAEVVVAAGLVINNPISKVIGNFFLSINKPAYPVKLFNSADEAYAWLKQFVV